MVGNGSRLAWKSLRLAMAGVLAIMFANALQSTQGRALAQSQDKPPKPAEKPAAAAAKTEEAKDLPKAEAILDRYIEVTGGKAAYEKVKNRVSTGSFEVPAQNMKGTIKIYQSEPNKMYTALEIPNVGLNEEGCEGSVAWERSPMMGPRVKDGQEKATALHSASFNSELNWRKLNKSVKTIGSEEIDGELTYKVELTPNEGNVEVRYFAKTSGFAVKSTTIISTQMGDMPVEAMISDYKKVEGITMPHKTKLKVPMQELVITLEKVENNVDMPKDRFDIPAEIKALLDKEKSEAKAGDAGARSEPAKPGEKDKKP